MDGSTLPNGFNDQEKDGHRRPAPPSPPLTLDTQKDEDARRRREEAEARPPQFSGFNIVTLESLAQKPADTDPLAALEKSVGRIPGIGGYAARALHGIGSAILKLEHSADMANIGNLNVGKSVDWINSHAGSCWQEAQGKCAKFVRLAFQAGGVDFPDNPGSAADYVNYFSDARHGFKEVAEGNGLNTAGYKPAVCDTCVWGRTAGHPDGHIAMFNGTEWVSDFKQIDMAGGSAFRNGDDFHIFRYQGGTTATAGAQPHAHAPGSHTPTVRV